MAQHDFVIDNQSAPNFRSDLNQALAALATTNGGGTAPAVTFAGQLWHDTSANALKIRNNDNDAWITLMVLDQAGDTSAPSDASVTFAKLAAAAVVTASETIASNNNDTTIPTSAAVKAYADSVGYTAPTTAGAIGTYGMFALSSISTAITAGTSYSGASLRAWGAAAVGLGPGAVGGNQYVGSAPSGTWRAMQSIAAVSSFYSVALFLRIS